MAPPVTGPAGPERIIVIDTASLLARVREDQYRLEKQPMWVQLLVRDLAHRLDLETRAAVGVRAAAEVEVSRAREDLVKGPADSDTFADMPRSAVVDDDDAQRPLGRGVNIEFRAPDDMPGEGINVKLEEDGALHVHGIGHMAVIPINHSYIKIQTR